MFKLSPHIDKNKVFLVNLSEIEGVLSPLFFKSKPLPLKYNQKLKKIANINPIRKKPVFDDNDLVPYIGLPETDEHTREITSVILRPYKEVKGRNVIYPNDILFARIEPSIFNQKYIFAGDLKGYDFAFTSTEFYIIEQKSINIKYIFHLLFSDYIFNQIKGKTTGSTGRRRLDLEAFKNIEIPVIDDYKKIIDLYETAYQTKQQKEAEVEKLLNSIDDYLLGELGITLSKKDNSLENRIFKVNFSKVTGNRWNSEYHQTYFANCYKSMSKLYNLVELSKLSLEIFQGVGRNLTDDNTYTLLKVKNIKRYNEIDYEDVEYVQNVPKFKLLKKNDIISPFIGEAIRQIKFSIFDKEDGSWTVDNNTGVIRLNQDLVNPLFISQILNSKIGRIQILQLIGGGGVPFLGAYNVKKFKIPLPPIEKQNEIAKHIKEIKEQAKKLKVEAKEVLEQAKIEVEKIILGE